MRSLLGHALFLLGLSGCAANYDVIRSGSLPGANRIEPNSISVVLQYSRPSVSVAKYEKGFGLQKPSISAEEKKGASAKSERLKLILSSTLASDTASSLGSYACACRNPKQVLALQLNNIVVDTNGSVEVTMTAVLGPSNGKPVWLRTVRVSVSQFGSEETVSRDLAQAVLAELRASGLVS